MEVGKRLRLTIEKPAAGGRMIARVDGQIVFVSGTIPGEAVTARIDRITKGVAYATAVSIDDASADRREPFADPLCGGCVYSHITYERQLDLKALVIADAFTRIARLALPAAVTMTPSPEDGYRMRARLHVVGSRIGFFREGTHEICDVRSTRQLLPATCDVLDRVAAGLRSLGGGIAREIELAENADASERVVHFEAAAGADTRALQTLAATGGLTPAPYVTDELTLGDDPPIRLRRHVLAFFQGNRYLLRNLVEHVIDQVPGGGDLIDLYAGAGLFSIAAAIGRAARVTAVEGDRYAAADLAANVQASRVSSGAITHPIETVHQQVEEFVNEPAARHVRGQTIIVDPPRTGMSRNALDGVVRLQAGRVIYVSCDVATLARDARRLVDAGYALERVDAFDMFPNTPPVETVAVFTR